MEKKCKCEELKISVSDRTHCDNRCLYKICDGVNVTENEIPRRIQMNKWSPAEIAIHNAIQEVEKAGADPRLTDAVILLGKAKDSVADFIEDIYPQTKCYYIK